MTDVTPGTGSPALTDMSTPSEAPQRIERRDFLAGWWGRGALVALVMVLGLVQGSRAALGDISLDDAPKATVDAAPPVPPAPEEADASPLRGRFYRPEGSDAVRPALRLRQSAWQPESLERLALACPDASC
jgi:hypothetical protein